MPIDVDKVLAADLPEATTSWGPDNVILYHLGIGAGDPPTDPNELSYTYEGNLKVLPSFAVVPVFSAMAGMLAVDGFNVDFTKLLHGEQAIELHRPIPTSAEVTSKVRISDIFDKGKAALAIMEVTTSDADGPLFTNRFSLFLRGEGGFGGDPGPKAENAVPGRDPDFVIESPTLPQQALLYRLSGDKNPLHADPNFAAFGGFDRPILHGLCSYGICCKAAVDAVLDGDVSSVASYNARFAGVFFPGETMVTKLWKEDGKIILESESKERGTPVISQSSLTLSS
jgi:acyl dehydratase